MYYAYFALMLFDIVGRLVTTGMRYLSIGAVSYYGVNFVVGEAKDYIINNFVTAPQLVQQILGLMKVDVAVNILLSAVSMRLILAGIDKVADGRKKYQTVFRA